MACRLAGQCLDKKTLRRSGYRLNSRVEGVAVRGPGVGRSECFCRDGDGWSLAKCCSGLNSQLHCRTGG